MREEKLMSAVLKTSIGKISYSEDFIGKIAGINAMECYGIVGMANKNATDGIVNLLKIDNLKRGVRVKTDETENVSVELYIVVKYGVSISAVAANIIETVKFGLENMTGLNVENVDVVVQGIKI
jgi:uncharacterized alkaline shock family protein YloU